MNNREIVEHRIKIMQAFLDNKEIQYRHDNSEVGGLWYDGTGPKSSIPNFSLYEYRIKPDTKCYRIAIIRSHSGDPKFHFPIIVQSEELGIQIQSDPDFICWHTDWADY